MTTMTDGTVRPTPANPSSAPAASAPTPSAEPAPVEAAAKPARPIRPNAQLSRSQILDATEECLVAKGYDGTTIRSIAAILGCAVGSIYRYFDDKRQLLDAVTQRRFRPVLEHVRARQKPHRTGMLYAQVASDQPQLYRLMFWLPGIDEQSDLAAIPTIVRQIIDGWATQFGSEPAAEAFWYQLHGRLILGRDPAPLLSQLAGGAAPTPTAAPAESPVAATVAGAPTPVPTRDDDVTLL